MIFIPEGFAHGYLVIENNTIVPMYKTSIKNILLSEDIKNSINCLKKLGISISLDKKKCLIYGRGLNGFKYKKNN